MLLLAAAGTGTVVGVASAVGETAILACRSFLLAAGGGCSAMVLTLSFEDAPHRSDPILAYALSVRRLLRRGACSSAAAFFAPFACCCCCCCGGGLSSAR